MRHEVYRVKNVTILTNIHSNTYEMNRYTYLRQLLFSLAAIIKQLLFSLTAVLTLPTAKAGGFASPATVIKSVTLNLKKVSHAELRFPLRSYALLIQITALSLH